MYGFQYGTRTGDGAYVERIAAVWQIDVFDLGSGIENVPVVVVSLKTVLKKRLSDIDIVVVPDFEHDGYLIVAERYFVRELDVVFQNPGAVLGVDGVVVDPKFGKIEIENRFGDYEFLFAKAGDAVESTQGDFSVICTEDVSTHH